MTAARPIRCETRYRLAIDDGPTVASSRGPLVVNNVEWTHSANLVLEYVEVRAFGVLADSGLHWNHPLGRLLDGEVVELPSWVPVPPDGWDDAVVAFSAAYMPAVAR